MARGRKKQQKGSNGSKKKGSGNKKGSDIGIAKIVKFTDHSSREQNIDFDEGLPSWGNESLLGIQVLRGGHVDDVGNLDDLV
ncbi:condensin complex subunit 2-like protein [Corchorus capsularis]|uniref:Condensin complex subunit 2-like protein n=1 Tax=Corchorus capsularis TaxID=210143 RepID=A0A1R3IDH8_COCAP|nr:condensin complex subunit 2-like protein [Corchorus capsularis]